MFTRAIVRRPGKSIVKGLTTANLGPPIYEKALAQHDAYINALQSCGLEVIVLDANEAHPDSTFMEDVALLTPQCAIIMNSSAPSRKGETDGIRDILQPYFDHIEQVTDPGTAEGGDIMMVGDHYYIGLSERTNQAGAQQIIGYLEKYGMSGSVVTFEDVLHLKTGVAYLEDNNLVASSAFSDKDEFQQFNQLPITGDELYAANCIWVNGTVLLPQGFPKAKQTIENAGYPTIALDVSEFQKLDGGLSCLSLRF